MSSVLVFVLNESSHLTSHFANAYHVTNDCFKWMSYNIVIT